MADSGLNKEEGSTQETQNKDDPTLPSKRKLDSLPVLEGKEAVQEDQPNRNLKLHSDTDDDNSPVIDDTSTGSQSSYKDSGTGSSIREDKNSSKDVAEGKDTGEDDDDDDGDFEDEKEDKGEASVVDRKGKGIMIEEEDDDDNDWSDYGSEFNGNGSEPEDDPLGEVDLDNILPSRTRQWAPKPGIFISDDHGKDDDNSDDSDA